MAGRPSRLDRRRERRLLQVRYLRIDTETKKQSLNTSAHANNTLHNKLSYPIEESARKSACEARP